MLFQREMYERVRGSEGAEVRIEAFEPTSSWDTIAATNVLPEVLLKGAGCMSQK